MYAKNKYFLKLNRIFSIDKKGITIYFKTLLLFFLFKTMINRKLI